MTAPATTPNSPSTLEPARLTDHDIDAALEPDDTGEITLESLLAKGMERLNEQIGSMTGVALPQTVKLLQTAVREKQQEAAATSTAGEEIDLLDSIESLPLGAAIEVLASEIPRLRAKLEEWESLHAALVQKEKHYRDTQALQKLS